MSHLEIEKYERKPFTVEAVRVTADNMVLVADWCEGEVRKTADGNSFVKVNVHRPATSRQTRAYIGDWVLFAGQSYKVYTEKAFNFNFRKMPVQAVVQDAIKKALPNPGTMAKKS